MQLIPQVSQMLYLSVGDESPIRVDAGGAGALTLQEKFDGAILQ